MPDETGPGETPTYFANIVTMNMSVDEMVIEFRRYLKAHKDLSLGTGPELKPIPPPAADEILGVEPVVRVVLTFSAAKGLMQYLNQALPQFEQLRKSQ